MSCVIRDGVYGAIRHLKPSPSNDEEPDPKSLCSIEDEISQFTGDIHLESRCLNGLVTHRGFRGHRGKISITRLCG